MRDPVTLVLGGEAADDTVVDPAFPAESHEIEDRSHTVEDLGDVADVLEEVGLSPEDFTVILDAGGKANTAMARLKDSLAQNKADNTPIPPDQQRLDHLLKAIQAIAGDNIDRAEDRVMESPLGQIFQAGVLGDRGEEMIAKELHRARSLVATSIFLAGAFFGVEHPEVIQIS